MTAGLHQFLRWRDVAAVPHLVPLMTHPLGRYWDQPSREAIAFVDGEAQMTERTFAELKNYSHTLPTGVYEGKMWRALEPHGGWSLVWYGVAVDPGQCSIEHRPIRVIP